MKIRIQVSPETEVVLEKDTDGNVTGLVFSPLFTQRKGVAVLLYGNTASDNGTHLESFSLTVSGVTGKLTKKMRNRIAAFADLTPEQRADIDLDASDDETEEDAAS